MKWFKHLARARKDIKIQKLIEEFGVVGYAYYFIIVEMCAESFERTGEPIFHFTMRQLCFELGCKPSTVRQLLASCSSASLYVATIHENQIEIIFPKLLEIKDEHTRKLRSDSGQTPDSREEKRREEIKNIKKESSPSGDQITKGLKKNKTQVPKDWESQPVIKAWNENCGALRKMVAYNQDTFKRAETRWNEHSEASYWIEAAKIAASDDFTNGKNDRGWKGNITWFTKAETAEKLYSKAKKTVTWKESKSE